MTRTDSTLEFSRRVGYLLRVSPHQKAAVMTAENTIRRIPTRSFVVGALWSASIIALLSVGYVRDRTHAAALAESEAKRKDEHETMMKFLEEQRNEIGAKAKEVRAILDAHLKANGKKDSDKP